MRALAGGRHAGQVAAAAFVAASELRILTRKLKILSSSHRFGWRIIAR